VEDIADLYNAGWSIHQIAKERGWHYSTTRSRLLRMGITLRSVSEGVHLAKRVSPVDLPERAMELFDGLLLGAGSLERGSVGSRFSLGQRKDRAEWLRDISRRFESYGIQHTIGRGARRRKVVIKGDLCQRRDSLVIRTRSYPALTDLYARWYPDGRRRIPADLRLTPLSISQWYWGDGYVGNGGYYAAFCTNGFTRQGVERLIGQLEDSFGWLPTTGARNQINLTRMEDRARLIEMVKPFVLPCFDYKLRLRTKHQRRVLTDEQRKELKELHEAGWSLRKLAERFGVSKSCAHYTVGLT